MNIKAIKTLFGFTKKEVHNVSEEISTTKLVEANNIDDLTQLDLSVAKKIILPILEFGHSESEEEREERLLYWDFYDKGYSYYQRGWYDKSISSFLNINGNKLCHSAYFTHLIRAYRKKIERLEEKKQIKSVLETYYDLFKNCKNYTNTDVNKYNKLLKSYNEKHIENDFIFIELVKNDEITDFEITDSSLELEQFIIKPRGWKTNLETNTIDDLKRIYGDYLPKDLPYLTNTNEIFELKEIDINQKQIHINFKIISDVFSDKLVLFSRDFKIHLTDNNFNEIAQLDVQSFVDNLYNLRYTNINKEENIILFSYCDTLYFCDEYLNIQKKIKIPIKDGCFKKEERNIDTHQIKEDFRIKAHLNTLNINNSHPSKDEIKTAFRSLAKIYHPDIHPEKEFANSKMKELINAYESLNKEDFINAFELVEERDLWYNSIHKFSVNVSDHNFEISVFNIVNPYDTIYCADFSKDELHIYIGTISGKIYKSNLQGKVEKEYIIPECETSVFNYLNVFAIKEIENLVYIKSSYFLYILENDLTIKFIDIDNAELKYFNQGFVTITEKKLIKIFSLKGELVGTINSVNNIQNILFDGEYFVIETKKKIQRVKIKNHA